MSDIEIDEICKKYGIKNYTIKDGLVNVDGDVDLTYRFLTELPIKFGEVTGNFKCYNNKLISLEGSPSYVGCNFYCGTNNLTSLEGSPRYVGGYFSCSNNYLADFKGCPDEVVGYFYCQYNKIYSLEGLLFKRIDNISIGNNPISDLYKKYNLDDIYHREFLIEADVIRPSKVKVELLTKRKSVTLPIINKDRMDWFTQTYGLEEFVGNEDYIIEESNNDSKLLDIISRIYMRLKSIIWF